MCGTHNRLLFISVLLVLFPKITLCSDEHSTFHSADRWRILLIHSPPTTSSITTTTLTHLILSSHLRAISVPKNLGKIPPCRLQWSLVIVAMSLVVVSHDMCQVTPDDLSMSNITWHVSSVTCRPVYVMCRVTCVK